MSLADAEIHVSHRQNVLSLMLLWTGTHGWFDAMARR